MHKFTYTCLLLLICLQSIGQQLKIADSLFINGDYSGALKVWKQEISKNPTDKEILQVLITIATPALEGNYNALYDAVKKNQARIFNHKELSHELKASIYNSYYHAPAYATGDWQEAKRIAMDYFKAVESKKIIITTTKKADLIYDIAYILGELSMHYEAIDYYKKAEALYEQENMKDSSDMALLYNNLGFSYSRLSSQTRSLEYYIKASEIWGKNSRGNLGYLVTAYNNIARDLMDYGNLKQAIYYIQKLGALIPLINKDEQETLFTAKGNFNVLQMRYAYETKDLTNQNKLLASFDAYKKVSESMSGFGQYYRTFHNTHVNLLIKTACYDAALFKIKNLEKEYTAKKDDLGLLLLYNLESIALLETKEYAQAIKSADHALKLSGGASPNSVAGLKLMKVKILLAQQHVEQAAAELTETRKMLQDFEGSIQTFSFLNEEAKLYILLAKKRNDPAYYKKAYVSAKNAINDFNTLYDNGQVNAKIAIELSKLSETLLEIAIHDKTRAAEVINHIENTRSKYLWANFLRNNNNKTLLLANKEYRKWQELTREIAYYKKELQVQKQVTLVQSVIIKNINDKIASLEDLVARLHRKMLKEYTNYGKLFENEFSIARLLTSLDKDEDLLAYYTGETAVYALHISKQKIVKIKKLGTHSLLEPTVKKYHGVLSSKQPYKEQAVHLYNLLVEPFQVNQKSLTIVTSGFLSYVPFETLIHDGAFLVQDKNIGYGSDLVTLLLQKMTPSKKGIDIAVFQPDYENGLYDVLPFAKREAALLKQQYGANLYAKQDATATNFYTKVNKHSVYHLAMHAVINEDDVESSRLILNGDELLISDLYARSLPLDLVFLGACETGIGQEFAGEGLISLSRAFTYSGTKSTIKSLWKAPDKQTYQLTSGFYKYLNKGYSKTKSLQLAKNDFLNEGTAQELKHPYYWAGFIISGDPEPLTTSYRWVYVFICSALLLGMSFLLFKFRKKGCSLNVFKLKSRN